MKHKINIIFAAFSSNVSEDERTLRGIGEKYFATSELVGNTAVFTRRVWVRKKPSVRELCREAVDPDTPTYLILLSKSGRSTDKLCFRLAKKCPTLRVRCVTVTSTLISKALSDHENPFPEVDSWILRSMTSRGMHLNMALNVRVNACAEEISESVKSVAEIDAKLSKSLHSTAWAFICDCFFSVFGRIFGRPDREKAPQMAGGGTAYKTEGQGGARRRYPSDTVRGISTEGGTAPTSSGSSVGGSGGTVGTSSDSRLTDAQEREKERRDKAAREAKLRLMREAASRQMELAGRKNIATEEAPCETVDVSQVQFSAVSPKAPENGETSIIDVYMYEEEFRGIVDKALNEADQPATATTSGYVAAQKKARVCVVLSSPDIEITDGECECVWEGRYQKFSFDFFLPADYAKKKVLFNVAVYINGVVATRLKFFAECESTAPIEMERKDIKSAFISYASLDRKTVTMIVQGLQAARQDMEVFFDVVSIRRGRKWEAELKHNIDVSDVLYLFWSRNAKRSYWVNKEWRYGLETKGIDFIEPIPLVHPDVCRPPQELSEKHFNDMMLYVRNG